MQQKDKSDSKDKKVGDKDKTANEDEVKCISRHGMV